jgi:hypothetical protein
MDEDVSRKIKEMTDAMAQGINDVSAIFQSEAMTKMVDALAAMQVRAFKKLTEGGINPDNAVAMIMSFQDRAMPKK